ncbi:tripartite tricarboxylate transporter permease [Thermococcus thioreducens]|nr:tripartite tricarboxylate transporter permease [Thermococcus thioreducens]SEW05069.1 putative membrane protein [Thermococcus thioreducens]
MLKGIIAGTISGTLPGIHVNTLGAFLAGIGAGDNLLLFSMGLTHTFLDVIPSAFLGVPDEGTALGILPAHRLVIRGKAMEVVRIALWASFLAVLMAIPLSLVYPILARLYAPRIGRVAVGALALLLILTESGLKRLYAVLVFLLSGLLGILAFRLPLKEPYYHLFTGLFGIPVLAAALVDGGGHVVPGSGEIEMEAKRFIGFSLLGTFLGMVASLIPAFTASQAALIGSFFSKDERSFLAVVFSVNTSNFLFSFMNFLETGRVRNGIVALMAPSARGFLPYYALAAVFVSLLVLSYGDALAGAVLRVLAYVPYRFMNGVVVTLLVLLSLHFDGLLGLLVLAGGGMVGFLAVLFGVKRTNCMGVLMLQIIIG